MGLSEGVRRIYGQPGYGQTQLGSWYQQYYRRPGIDVDEKRRIAIERANRWTLPDPSRVQSGRGVSKAGRTTTTRGLAALFSDDKGPNDPRLLNQIQQQYGAALQTDPTTGLPQYLMTSSGPGTYQMAQQRAQEERGLYTEVHMKDPGNWPPSEIARIQRQLVKAGLLTTKFHLGVFDPATQEAYAGLLSMANDNGGKTKNEMLEQLVSTNPDDLLSLYRKPQFIKPDREALVEDIESVFQDRLGREPTADERRHLANHYMKQAQREFRLETEPQAFNEFIGGTFNEAQAVLGMTPEQRAVREIDPGKRFASYFRKRYRNEELEIKRRERQHGEQRTAQAAFDELRTMMGAGGVQQLGS